MVDFALMIEGQDGLTWPRWIALLRAVEELGFSSVFRSDHFVNPHPPEKPSLEMWASLTYAASHTRGIEFGPLVTPVTFRLPAMTARQAAAVDDLSGGRLVLGIGAGWNEREHAMFGIPFPPTNERLEMLEEYVRVVELLLRSDEPVSFEGKHYRLEDAILLPRPSRANGPPILIGGNGTKRTLPIAARYADEWNAVGGTPDRLRELMRRLDECLDEEGRPHDAVKRSVMLSTCFAPDEAALQRQAAEWGATVPELQAQGVLAGTPAMWIEQLSAYADTGVQRIMLQWLDQDNLADLEIIARDVFPAVGAGTAAAS